MRMCRVQDIATRYTDCETAAGAAAHPRLCKHRASGALSSWQRFDKGPWERPLRRQPARYDYEYERNGTANLFMMFAPLEGCRHRQQRRGRANHHVNAAIGSHATDELIELSDGLCEPVHLPIAREQ